MARIRSKIEVTLFPFLSVLCGLIAVLILHIFVVLETGRAEARGARAVGPATAGPVGGGGARERETAERKQRLIAEVLARKRRLEQLAEEREQLERVLELRAHQDLVAA